jgi:hypothetical protein
LILLRERFLLVAGDAGLGAVVFLDHPKSI